AGKLQNSRQVLLRAARENSDADDTIALTDAAGRLAAGLVRLKDATRVDEVRGIEGAGARAYFDGFEHTIRADRGSFAPNGRTRRPPLDRTNSVLSFLYALLRTECSAALEGVGLDPQIGFLHVLRPGRPALALDLMEEFRPVLADRLAITLINRRQLQADQFEELPGGAIHLTDAGRKVVLVAYQKRKEEEVQHRVLKEKVPIGLIPHIQARLLARHLRGDLKDYPPFLNR
ncbi:MAG TPA: CRISPR-associated endonuclease Cas1, partial [Chloroflexota bacterium]|nr:CRISPR-associated endonuclease Cas1 [Chloroflexota bacterium]